MFQKFISKKGTSFILAPCSMTVDELIGFLEQYRGLQFFMGAAEDLAFIATDTGISCESFDYLCEWAQEESQHLEEKYVTSSILTMKSEQKRSGVTDMNIMTMTMNEVQI